MNLAFVLICVVVGLLAGTFGSLVGLGGGVVIIPSLLYLATVHPHFAHVTPAVAAGSSLVLVIFTALSSTISYGRQKRIDLQVGSILALACAPGALIGAMLTRFFSPDRFYLFFALLMLLVAYLLGLKKRAPQQRLKWSVKRTAVIDGQEVTYGYQRTVALTFAFVVGLLSGMFGIGGGSLLLPMMILLFGFPPHLAAATSMFTILLTSVLGSLQHIWQGEVDWWIVLTMAPGAWLGGQLGVWISNRLSSKWLLVVLRVAFVLVAIRMLLAGIHLL